MAGCGCPVDYYIPKGFSYKKLEYKCGNTGIDGFPVLCNSCEAKHARTNWYEEALLDGERIDDDY